MNIGQQNQSRQRPGRRRNVGVLDPLVPVLVVLTIFAGCDEPKGAREVPVSTRTSDQSTNQAPETKPARAIATH